LSKRGLMLDQVLAEVSLEASGANAKQSVEQICKYHRIQSSPGIHDAAKCCLDIFRMHDLDGRILSYPADGKTPYGTVPAQKEWSIFDAELRIIEPKAFSKTLCSFNENKLSIIQRSCSTPQDGIACELVALESGEEAREYRGLDLRGKIVLASGDIERVHSLAVQEHGAIGIVTDRITPIPPIRKRTDLSETRQYASFWWYEHQRRCFGFVITPRQGDELRKLVSSQRMKNPVKLFAKVNAHFQNGRTENVTAVIDGKTTEEVLLVAHLCHPQPSANDNASGCGTAIEVARTLRKLIKEKRLPKPRRRIRFLLGPEMTGTRTFLASKPSSRIVAAINLDMVGEDQDICKSSMLIESPPKSTPTYGVDLLENILEHMSVEAGNLYGTSRFALFRHEVVSFSGGSDHEILSDPTIGIPCPMLTQWPDKYYHTSDDTIDKVDPKMLERTAVLTATYAYFIANSSLREAIWLAHESFARFKRTLALSLQAKLTRFLDNLSTNEAQVEGFISDLGKYSNYMASTHAESTKAIMGLVEEKHRKEFSRDLTHLVSETHAFAKKERQETIVTLRHLIPKPGNSRKPSTKKLRISPFEKRAVKTVPKRIFRGSIEFWSFRFLMTRLPKKYWEDLWALKKRLRAHQTEVLPALAVYWVDGRRTLKEISDLVYFETGKHALEELVSIFRLLEKAKLMELV